MLCHSIWLSGVQRFLDTRIGAYFDNKVLLLWGCNYGPLTLGGQYWRVLTTLFVHLNIFHLGSNMLFLWRLGKPLDRFLGRTQALAVYLLTGTASSLASLAWQPKPLHAGSSGAIYGQGGVLIALLVLAKLNLPRRQTLGILFWIVLMMPFELLFGHFDKTIGYAAHAGGLASGLAIGVLFAGSLRGPLLQRASRQRWELAATAFVLVLSFGGVIAMRHDLDTQDIQQWLLSKFTSGASTTTTSGTEAFPKDLRDGSWWPKWDTDPDKTRKVKSVLTPTVSFAEPGFRGSPAPQNDREKEQEQKSRELFVDSFRSEPKCYGITLKLKNPGDADFALQVFHGIDGRTDGWQYVLYRMDTLGVKQLGETPEGPKSMALSVCSVIRDTVFTRGGSVE
jgi:membrane associated rhomboid family serine protease